MLIAGKQGLLEALMEVYSMEKGTTECYEKAAATARNKDTKNAFQSLAQWEASHMSYIGYLYQAIMEDRETASFEEFSRKLHPEAIEGGITAPDTDEWVKEFTYADERGAVEAALKVEAKAYALYERLSDGMQDATVGVFIKELMLWERGHMEYLKSLRRKIKEKA